jgi:hypothetical protein
MVCASSFTWKALVTEKGRVDPTEIESFTTVTMSAIFSRVDINALKPRRIVATELKFPILRS